jgi:hypothetical protein
MIRRVGKSRSYVRIRDGITHRDLIGTIDFAAIATLTGRYAASAGFEPVRDIHAFKGSLAPSEYWTRNLGSLAHCLPSSQRSRDVGDTGAIVGDALVAAALVTGSTGECTSTAAHRYRVGRIVAGGSLSQKLFETRGCQHAPDGIRGGPNLLQCLHSRIIESIIHPKSDRGVLGVIR